MKKVAFIFVLFYLVSCGEKGSQFVIDSEYLVEFEKKTEGGLAYDRPFYMQLIHFSKLDPMTLNRFGSASDNEHVLDATDAPDIFGTLEVFSDSVLFIATEGYEVKTENDSIVTQMMLRFNDGSEPVDFYLDRYSWRVVSYGGEHKYLRIRDLESSVVDEFRGYERFEFTSDYIFNAKFEAYDPPKVISVPSSVDFERTATFVGSISFEYQGEQYSLDVQDGHIMFSDETSALQTYGSGRYMKYSKPAEDGSIVLDFNYAYNPPCIFSDYTTCLFPPEQNRLPFEVLAGEKTESL